MGSESRTETPCPPGKYCKDGVAPISCPDGSYTNSIGNVEETDCFPCEAGFICEADSLPIKCEDGVYCIGSKQENCGEGNECVGVPDLIGPVIPVRLLKQNIVTFITTVMRVY